MDVGKAWPINPWSNACLFQYLFGISLWPYLPLVENPLLEKIIEAKCFKHITGRLNMYYKKKNSSTYS
jgi:hypothetical protein